jgi:hypothetical protein
MRECFIVVLRRQTTDYADLNGSLSNGFKVPICDIRVIRGSDRKNAGPEGFRGRHLVDSKD